MGDRRIGGAIQVGISGLSEATLTTSRRQKKLWHQSPECRENTVVPASLNGPLKGSPQIPKSGRSELMASVRTRGTTPELAVRNILRVGGYKYVCNGSQLPGRPDIVLPTLRKVVLVHGCFWHGHVGCKKASIPKTNRDFWLPKLKRNIQRDSEQKKLLRQLGWKCFTVWECQIRDGQKWQLKLLRFLGEPVGQVVSP